MILDQSELAALTNKTRRDAQVKVLRFMGIEHRIRPDGTVAVLKSHVERVLCGEAGSKMKEHEPDWSAI